MSRFLDCYRAMGEGFGVGRQILSVDHVITCYIKFPSRRTICIDWGKDERTHHIEECLASEIECSSRYEYIVSILSGGEVKPYLRWDFGETEEDAEIVRRDRIEANKKLLEAGFEPPKEEDDG